MILFYRKVRFMDKDIIRIKVTEFLQWNDRNGCYTDENCDLECISRMTYEESIKYFFCVINVDFYCRIVDNFLSYLMMK